MKLEWIDKITDYAEIYQKNKIRWAVLSGTPEEGFVNETNWFRCREYFNDFVYTIQTGKKTSMYGMHTGDLKLPNKGEPMYVAVRFTYRNFLHNLSILECPEPIEATEIEDNLIVLKIPPIYLERTYNISLITLMIRLANFAKKFENFEEFNTRFSTFEAGDAALWYKVAKHEWMFDIPKELEGFVWWKGERFNNLVKVEQYQLPHLVHNNGVVDHYNAFVPNKFDEPCFF